MVADRRLTESGSRGELDAEPDGLRDPTRIKQARRSTADSPHATVPGDAGAARAAWFPGGVANAQGSPVGTTACALRGRHYRNGRVPTKIEIGRRKLTATRSKGRTGPRFSRAKTSTGGGPDGRKLTATVKERAFDLR